MQPYLFPYMGYFQLIHAVDKFVIYDDVNFIKGGWINRNFILSQGQKKRITLQLQGASPNLLINQVMVGTNKNKLLKTIKQSYSKAPQYDSVYRLIEGVVLYDEANLARYIDNSLRKICDYLNIKPKWYISSNIKKDISFSGQDKILSICRELEASTYINAVNGLDLYEQSIFNSSGVNLQFIKSKLNEYSQFGNKFIPSLSIIDVLMFNSVDRIKVILNEYSLIK